jgi:hypothetical protein
MMFARLTFFIFYIQIFRPRYILFRWIREGALVTTRFYLATSICQVYCFMTESGQSWVTRTAKDLDGALAIIGIVGSSFGIMSDIYLFALAAVGIWQPQMQAKESEGSLEYFLRDCCKCDSRALLLRWLTTDTSACVASIAGLVYRLRLKNGSDMTFDLLPLAILV